MTSYTICSHMPGACAKYPYGNPDLIFDVDQKKAAVSAALSVDPKYKILTKDVKENYFIGGDVKRPPPATPIVWNASRTVGLDIKGMDSTTLGAAPKVIKRSIPLPPTSTNVKLSSSPLEEYFLVSTSKMDEKN